MEFSVIFKLKKDAKGPDDDTSPFVIGRNVCDFGTALIDDLRSSFNLTKKECPLDNIQNSTCSNNMYYLEVIPNEEQARKCGKVFINSCKVHVEVPHNFLTGYQDYDYEKYSTNSSFIERVLAKLHIIEKPKTTYSIKRKILTDDILEDWQKAGCPLEWGFEK